MTNPEDVVAGSGNLFAPVQPPCLPAISCKAIQEFLAERSSYEAAVEAQPGINPVPYVSCFDAIFLRSLVRARLFGKDVTDVNQLSDDLIKTKLLGRSGGVRSVSYEEVMADVKRNIKPDVSEPDPSLRIFMLRASYLDICERRGWNCVDSAPKSAVRHIIAVLQPPELKIRMQDALRLEKSSLEDDLFGFCDYLEEQAPIVESFHPLRKFRQNSTPSNPIRKSKPFGSGSSCGGGGPSTSSPKKTAPPCLNPACKEDHWVRDCKMTSPELKKKLIAKARAKKSGKSEPKWLL
ncbi:unnamed protein product [Agarophyton chilense]